MPTLRDLNAAEAANMLVGGAGFKRLTSGTHTAGSGSHTDVKEFRLIVNPGAASVAANGDAPATTDAIASGNQLPCRLTTIVVTSGIGYAFFV